MEKEFLFLRITKSGRKRAVKVAAVDFKNAVSKGLALHGHLKYKLPHNPKLKSKMDLATAVTRAAKASKDTGRPYYVILDDKKSGECSVNAAPIGTALHKFVKGKENLEFTRAHERIEEKKSSKVNKEIPEGFGIKSVKNEKQKTETIMTKKGKEVAAAKKGAAKKEVAPAKKSAAKKETTKRVKYTDGKKVTMTNKEMSQKIKKGYIYFNEAGQNKTKYIPERPNQDLENKNYYEVAPK